MPFVPCCTKITRRYVFHMRLSPIFYLVMNCNRSLITFALQTRSGARQAYITPLIGGPMENRIRQIITSVGSLFFRKHASGQPVVQEVDPISTPLEETNRPNGPEVTSDNISTFRTTPVSKFKAILPSLLVYFERRIQTFKAGSLAAYSHIWREMTSDPEVLETVTGQYIEFDMLPMQAKPLTQTNLSKIETESVDSEIIQLLKKGIQRSHSTLPTCGWGIYITCFYQTQEGWLFSHDFKLEVI